MHFRVNSAQMYDSLWELLVNTQTQPIYKGRKKFLEKKKNKFQEPAC